MKADPVFVALESFREAERAHRAACDGGEDFEQREALDHYRAACRALCRTIPTTREGFAALVRFAAGYTDEKEGCDLTEESAAMFRSLANSLNIIA